MSGLPNYIFDKKISWFVLFLVIVLSSSSLQSSSLCTGVSRWLSNCGRETFKQALNLSDRPPVYPSDMTVSSFSTYHSSDHLLFSTYLYIYIWTKVWEKGHHCPPLPPSYNHISISLFFPCRWLRRKAEVVPRDSIRNILLFFYYIITNETIDQHSSVQHITRGFYIEIWNRYPGK